MSGGGLDRIADRVRQRAGLGEECLARDQRCHDRAGGMAVGDRFDPGREIGTAVAIVEADAEPGLRSEEHTSELQSLMRISYAVFCLKKKKTQNKQYTITSN